MKQRKKQNMDGQLYCEAHVPITKPPLSPETDDKVTLYKLLFMVFLGSN
ncbi:Hypothetical predicted protein [Mytilus galloprovincialis]|uniref:Uncharacterized protein n=1 Tax=Mytilus galloprovincialis TaxID=29158 RepID=A0A8B6CQE0_MYTGA|nr:Hypothetical predicted protein [Mytilus galloprovincialis]